MKKILGFAAVVVSAAFIFASCGSTSGVASAAPAESAKEEAKTEAKADAPAAEVADPEGTLKAEDITPDELKAMMVSSGTGKIATAGEFSIWGGKGSIVTAANKMALKGKNGVAKAINSATNIDGATAKEVPVVGASKTLVNYVKVGTVAPKEKVTIKYSTNESTKPLEAPNLSYWILVTDEAGTILAVEDVGDISKKQSENAVFTTPAIDVGANICIGFARGAGSGGLLIHSIAQEPAE